MMATLEPYKLQWDKGEDRRLIVSIGTGSVPNAKKKLKSSQMNLLYNAKHVPSALIYAATVEADKLCRVAGRCHFGEVIDREIGDLVDLPIPRGAFGSKDFTYVRYDPNLTEAGLTELGLFPAVKPEDVLPLMSGTHLDELRKVGDAYARKVDFAHFGPFDPRLART